MVSSEVDVYLQEIADAVSIPCLRKDFTVDEYMIYEAKTSWCIRSASDLLHFFREETIREYIRICDEPWSVSTGGSP